MFFRHLTVSAACAALLGLTASRVLGPHLIEMASEAAPIAYREPPDEPAAPGGESATLVDAQPEEETITVPATRRSSRRARPASRAVPDSFAEDLSRGISKLGEGRYEIKRGALDLALANVGALPRFVRVSPDFRDGQPSGFRLSGVRGPFAKLGLRTGDVLVSVNGLDISTPDRVLEAYGKLKASSHLVLGLLRAGERIVQEYVVR
jgi:general secretion pathway protein C